MGTVVEFPKKKISGSPTPSRPTRSAPPALEIADDLPGPPEEEFRLGLSEGLLAVHWYVDRREDFLRLARARQAGRLDFLRALQRCAFVAENTAAAEAPLGQFEAFVYGARGGGIHGAYAAGHRAAFALSEPFVASLH